MKKFLTLFALSLFSISTLAATQYVGINFGSEYPHLSGKNQDKSRIGYKAGLTYGHSFDYGIRTEAEIAYRKNPMKIKHIESELVDPTSHTLYSWSVMANLLYDFEQLSMYTVIPYVGIGAGFCQNSEKIKCKFDYGTMEEKERYNRFAYQAIIGFKYPISHNVEFGLQYHYFCGRNHSKDHSVGMTLVRGF